MNPKPVVAAVTTLSDYFTGLGLEAGKNHFKDRFDEKKIQNKLQSYIKSQKKYDEMCKLAEEIDFEGLVEYIKQQLMPDVEKRLFGRKQERRSARDSIISCSVVYSKANSPEARRRVVRLIGTVIDIICDFYRSGIDKKDLLLAAEIEDTVIEEVKDSERKITESTCSAIEAAKDEIISEVKNIPNLVHSQNIASAIFQEKGNADGLKLIMNCAAGAIQYSHPLSPYYETAVEMQGGVAHVKSVPAIPEAKERYPQTVQGKIKVPIQRGSSFNKLLQRAYLSQTPLEIEVVEMKKMLGDVEDPFQDDFQKEWKKMHYRLMPSDFPPPFKCAVGIQGCKETFDITLAYQPVDPDDHVIVLSNRDYGEEMQISLTYHRDSGKTDINYIFHSDDWKQLAKFTKFMINAKQGSKLYINTDDGKNTVFFAKLSKPLYGQEYDELLNNLNLIKDIMLIEAQFDISLNPAIELQDDDLEMIKFLADSIRGEAKKCTWDRFTASAVLIPAHEEVNLMEIFSQEIPIDYVEYATITVQNQKIENVPVEVILECAKFENPQSALSGYEKAIGKTSVDDLRIEICMVPGSKGNGASRRVKIEEI